MRRRRGGFGSGDEMKVMTKGGFSMWRRGEFSMLAPG